jgi:hypothetical protein
MFGSTFIEVVIGLAFVAIEHGGRWFLECIVIDMYGRCAVYA